MRNWDRGAARHLLMRAGLAFVLSWFGIQELRNPSEWAVFVPSFVLDHSPVAVDHLILVHGFLLLLAAVFIAFGLLYLLGCLLAMGLLSEIVVSLWLDGGVSGLVIRDLGLLALAGALAVDPVRSWQLDGALLSLLRADRAVRRVGKGAKVAAPERPSWLVQAGGGALLASAVLGLAFLLQTGGTSSTALPQGSMASSSSGSTAASPAPSPAPPSSGTTTPVPSGSAATPTPSDSTGTGVRFDDWRYKQYAFQVYPGDIGSQTKRALAGFDLSVRDQGDSVVLVFKALSSRYRDAEISLDKGNVAYFIETSMQDDPNGLENNLNDDGVIVVNPQGYIVQS